MRTMLVLAVAGQLAAFPASPQAQTPGVTKDEIRIGQTMPHSGNVSAYGVVGKAMQAYFEKINREQVGSKDGCWRRNWLRSSYASSMRKWKSIDEP